MCYWMSRSLYYDNREVFDAFVILICGIPSFCYLRLRFLSRGTNRSAYGNVVNPKLMVPTSTLANLKVGTIESPVMSRRETQPYLFQLTPRLAPVICFGEKPPRERSNILHLSYFYTRIVSRDLSKKLKIGDK